MKKLNFGCGNDLRLGWDNCDVQKGNGVIYCDANIFPYPFKDSTYDIIYAKQVLEMVEKPDKVLEELWRIGKDGARILVIVPYWHNKGAFNDIQTKHYFNENSFIYFVEQIPCRIERLKKFKIVRLKKRTTLVGALIPEILRRKIDLFFSGLYSEMEVMLEIRK